MANEKECQVCGYKFLEKDFDSKKSEYKCPYCGTIKKLYNSQTDLNRLSLLNSGYDYLTKAQFDKASEEFTQYISSYPDNKDDTDLVLGNALANCSLSNCLSFKNDKMITVSSSSDLSKVINSKSFRDIERINSHIYDNVMELYNSNEKKYDNEIMLIALDESKILDLSSKLEGYNTVLYVDIAKDNIESIVYKNIQTSLGLIVYVDDEKLLTNAYFLSIYYRFINNGKNVILLSDGDVTIPKMFNNVLNINDDRLVDEIISIISTKAKTRRVDSNKFKEANGKITEFTSSDTIVVPTNMHSIASRAGFEKNLTEIKITTPGSFTVEEKAFTSSTIETFEVENKGCTIIFESDAFSKCKSLRKLIFKNKNITFDVGVFRDCKSLRRVDLSETEIEKIPSHLFDGAENLSEIDLPNTIKTISKYAFKNTKVEEITISGGVRVDREAFGSVSDLTVNVIDFDKTFSNIDIEDDSFPDNTTIVFKGSGFKKSYKTLKKEFPNYIVKLEK